MLRPHLQLRRQVARVPALAWLIFGGASLGPWVVGAWLWYVMTVLRAFGVELAPTR